MGERKEGREMKGEARGEVQNQEGKGLRVWCAGQQLKHRGHASMGALRKDVGEHLVPRETWPSHAASKSGTELSYSPGVLPSNLNQLKLESYVFHYHLVIL